MAHFSQSNTWQPAITGTLPPALLPALDDVDLGALLTSDMNWLPTYLDADLSFDFFNTQSPSFFDRPASDPMNASVHIHSMNTQTDFAPDDVATDTEIQAPQTPASFEGESSVGALYATSGDGARAPFGMMTSPTRKATRSQHIQRSSTYHHDDRQQSYCFPELSATQETQQDSGSPYHTRITDAVYLLIRDTFKTLCTGSDSHYTSFKTAEFPARSQPERLVNLYRRHFEGQLRISPAGSDGDIDCPELIIAEAALGASYAEDDGSTACTEPLLELCRRATAAALEKQELGRHSLMFVHALLLLQIGLLYHSNLRWMTFALQRHATLVELVRKNNLLAHVDAASTEQETYEYKARLGYAIWLLDGMLNAHFGHDTSFTLADARAPLPRKSGETSRHFLPSLHHAVISLFTKRQYDIRSSEFAQLLMLYGIRSEVKSVEHYHNRALFSWTPFKITSNSEDAPGVSEPTPTTPHSHWLPSEPAFAKWRNAACDCMDVLHWQANSMIAANFGKEHDTVFHLHFARIALLVPLQEIECLIHTFGPSIAALTVHVHAQADERRKFEQDILHWVRRDEHKARLSMLHVGALIWYVRRFSDNAFYEARSVYLSILCLWAYSTYTATPASQGATVSHDQGPTTTHNDPSAASPGIPLFVHVDEDEELSFVRLDRPVDDEMAQIWVRNGRPGKTTALISGVGDINAKVAPLRILALGQKLLAGYALTWRGAHNYSQILERLATIVSNFY
ncbi:Hypothetical protein D9617_17g047540 [Elsinoe fawcettii]|nr:Hypothetical protein D9617_17g047540 [Elsinoe fawcettii]